MSKELTALEWLNYYKDKLRASGQTIRQNGFDIIETTLKNYERLLKMRETVGWADEILQVKKKLKALEIIKSFNYYQVVEVQGQWYLIQGISFDKSPKMPITEEQALIILQEVLL